MTAPRLNLCGYVSAVSPQTRRLWEQVERNRQAFLRETTPERRERLMGLTERPSAEDVAGLGPAAAAHARFCWAVSAERREP